MGRDEEARRRRRQHGGGDPDGQEGGKYHAYGRGPGAPHRYGGMSDDDVTPTRARPAASVG
jgi:hypothetical protein